MPRAATNINRRTAPLFALGFVFGMPLAGMVVAGLRRKNGGLNLKSPGGAILLFVLMGVACYGCASAAINHNYGNSIWHLHSDGHGYRRNGAAFHSGHAHGAVITR